MTDTTDTTDIYNGAVDATPDRRLRADAADRNREPIWAVLDRLVPHRGLLLEIAAGTGQHAVAFAARRPDLTWQPTDADPRMRASIAAWAARAGLANLRPPLDLDVTADPWPVTAADAIFCANMVHIAPWACCRGLMAGAGRVLAPGGPLALYGPFMVDGAHTAPSNAAFDAQLRARDPAWGVRDRAAVAAEAEAAGLDLEDTVPMPSNNFILVFRRRR